MIVRREDLILTREERDRFERDHAVATATDKPAATDVWHSDDFTRVRVASEWHSFGPKQAAVLRLLKAASDSDNPWLDGKRLLEEADAATMRLIDLFKRKPVWRQMIEADGKGRYRLNVDLLSPERRRIRFYRRFKSNLAFVRQSSRDRPVRRVPSRVPLCPTPCPPLSHPFLTPCPTSRPDDIPPLADRLSSHKRMGAQTVRWNGRNISARNCSRGAGA